MKGAPRFLVIPAAGLGTRMRIINPDVPKELLPIANKPAIQYTVEEGLDADIRNIIIIIHKDKEIIRRYFEDRATAQKLFPSASDDTDKLCRECSFTFLYQKEPKGESDAIAYAREMVGDHSLAIHYPDNIYFPAPGALKRLKTVYEQYHEDVAALMEVTEVNAEGISNSGRVDLSLLEQDIFRIMNFFPKGEGHFLPRSRGELRTCGIAISSPHLFEYIERARPTVTEGEFTDVPVRSLILKEKGLIGVRLPGTVFDVGNSRGYELCLKHFQGKR